MNLYAHDLLNTPLGLLLSLLVGTGFGFWLERAGFGSARKLTAIFPKVEQLRFEGDFGETSTYVGDWSQTYEREHQAIFGPIAGLYTLVRRLSSGIIHTVGAMG